MGTNDEITIQQEVGQVSIRRPHVVVLGAGASLATCPLGDKNGKILPLMQNLVDVVGLRSKLRVWGLNPDQNFEEIFSELYIKNELDKIAEIQKIVEDYFGQLELPDKPTRYDHLILSLRDKDLIATFNWDPLLIQAYCRNGKAGLSMPKLAFLHGNIKVGYCEKDSVAGLIGMYCKKCGKDFQSVPLFYPIGKKDYSSHLFIANEWEQLKLGFESAFMITIFGYSGPKTDQEAIASMRKAWGNKYEREMEQTAFITPNSEEKILETWEPFIHTHHYEINDDFYKSWIANHPRRTGEAWRGQYLDAKYISNNPIPKDLDFPELWRWYEQFKKAEQASFDS